MRTRRNTPFLTIPNFTWREQTVVAEEIGLYIKRFNVAEEILVGDNKWNKEVLKRPQCQVRRVHLVVVRTGLGFN